MNTNDLAAGSAQTAPVPNEIKDLLASGRWDMLARRLGFDTTRRAALVDEALGSWGIERDCAAAFDRIEVFAAEPGFRLMLVQGEADYRELRRIMLAVGRLNPDELVIWWWASPEQFSVAMVDRRLDGRAFVRRMSVERREPDPVGLRQLAELTITDVAGGDLLDRTESLRRHVHEVLDKERLTREFFTGFADALDQLRQTMEQGPGDQRDRHDVALATLLRLVFLYFLQLRGALDADRRFVLRGLRQARLRGEGFYESFLRPLFFDALNRPRDQRTASAKRLGALPFLNGGLFEPLPVERAHPNLSWPDAVFADIIEGLLERYHFAAEELEGADEQRAVDPEMLGRVFEGLMYGESRQTSGSFYTPRDVVSRLVDEALSGYLQDSTDLDAQQIAAVLAGEPTALDAAQRASVRAALDSVRILDPAVGTGAFLLEALDVLRRCRRALEPAQLDSQHTAPLGEYIAVRQLIHAHLFGVDSQHTAVRLCELRLWLALLATLPDEMPIDELPPLPNLSHKVCVGNSLLAPTDLVELRSERGSFASWSDGPSNRQLLARLQAAQQDYLTSHGDRKIAARERMRGLEEQLQQVMLQAKRASLVARLEPLTALSSSKDLFGDEVSLNDEQRGEREALQSELAAVDQAIDALDAGRESRLAFSYATRFGQLLAEGGFEIVITNPPWVRAHRIDASQRDLLRSRYRCHRRQLWPSAKAAGIRAPFGPQVDLAALFVERSLELLREGGRLCGLVPAKLFTSLHGTALREQLANHALVALEDYSDGRRQMFDATVYPAMLHVQKRATSQEASRQRGVRRRACRKPRSVRLSVWRGDHRHAWRSAPEAIFTEEAEPGAPWVFAPPKVTRLFDKMRRVSLPLGQVDHLQPMRGLFTGCNAVFVHPEAEARELLGAHFEEFSRSVLSGRDVRPWSVHTERRILWPYDNRLELRDDLPEPLMRYFAGHAERLEGRSDYRAGQPLWQMFRVKDGIARPKVVWRDLSPKLEAALAPSEVVPLNTVYFIPLDDDRQARLLSALLNSPPVRAAAYAYGERARGGWRRHFAWVMRLLPVPRRFADLLEAEPDRDAFADIARIERAAGDDDEALARQLSAHLFELDPGEMTLLEGWRTGAQGVLGEVA